MSREPLRFDAGGICLSLDLGWIEAMRKTMMEELGRRNDAMMLDSMRAGRLEFAAQSLLDRHLEDDSGIVAAYWIDDPAEREIRLVEVSTEVGNTGEILPFRFASAPEKGLPYPLVMILICPAELRAIRAGTLRLPPGWGAMKALYVPKCRGGMLLFRGMSPRIENRRLLADARDEE